MDSELCKVYDVGQLAQSNKCRQTKIDFEEALDRTGIGKFNYFILSVCALGLLSNGIQNGISAYLLPSLQCEFNISTSEMAFLNISFMIGGIFSIIWGVISNLVGRKTILMVTFYADFIVTFIGSFSQNYIFYIVSRFLCGFFTGGPGYLLFTYLADFTPRKVRASYICYAGFSFILSWIILPGVGLLIIPLNFNFDFGLIKFNSWRLYSLIFTLPSLLTAIMIFKLPESPRQLLAKGETQKCIKILKEIFVKNTKQPAHYFNINTIPSTTDRKNNKILTPNNHVHSLSYVKGIIGEAVVLFTRSFYLKTTNLVFVMFTSMFGSYGLGLWIPELLLRLRSLQYLYPNESTTICHWRQNDTASSKNTLNPILENGFNLSYTNYIKSIHNANNLQINEGSAFCKNVVDAQIYRDSLVIGMACLSYNFVTACLSQHLNTKYLSSISMALGSFSAFLFVSLNSPSLCLAAISVFQSAMTTANVIIISVILEAFPPNLSSMAVCLATLGGRIGAICSNLCFGMLIEISCYYPIFIVSGLSMSGAILLLLIKKYEPVNFQDSNDLEVDNFDSISTHI